MKKILLFILLLVPFNVLGYSADAMIAVDLDNDYVYYGKNISEEKLIASITKIMSAIVVIEESDLSKNVEVGKEVLRAHGSAIYIQMGEVITIKDLLYGLLLRSGNDAAEVLATSVAGSMDEFAKLMNNLAKKIGMNNTKFVNASGLEENDGSANKSTALDMAILTKYAYKNKIFREIFGTKSYTCKTNLNTYSWKSKNKLIHTEDYITGGKTGYTKKAKRTLVTTASRNNLNVVVVTLNDGNDFSDHKNMYKSIYESYHALKVVSRDEINLKSEKRYKNDTLYLKNDIYIPIKNNSKDKIDIEYNLNSDKYKDGDCVGSVSIKVNDKKIRSEGIYVKVNKKKNKISWIKKLLRWLLW